MDANSILKATTLDLLFDGRNKDYGAYELRKHYNRRMILSLTLLFVTSGLVLSFTFANHKEKIKESIATTPFKTIKVNIATKPPIPKVDKPKDHPTKHVTKNPIKLEVKSYVPPKIVKDELFDEKKSVKKMSDLVDAHIADFDQHGKIGNLNIPAIKTDIDGNGMGKLVDAGNGSKDGEKEEKETIVSIVQKEAMYPTGKEGWINYLKRNLQSGTPSENGAPLGNYTVLISFIVDRNGNISDVKAENNPGYGTAEEAIKVIKRSGKWIPAIQNGRNVIYRQRQQITFQVSD